MSVLGKCVVSLERAGFEIWGIEPSVEFRERALQNTGAEPSKIILKSVEQAEFDRESFDFITFGAVLEHLYDPSESIKKALTWLKPGGVIQIKVPNSNHLIARLVNMYFRIRGTNFVTNLSPMHSPYHLYEFTLDTFRLNGLRLGYQVAAYKYMVCSIYHIPAIMHPLARLWMWRTNTGMQLTVYLRKSL